ncbi:hypothetical protein VUR80DRAFT_9942 [Thermomyces stellatus]
MRSLPGQNYIYIRSSFAESLQLQLATVKSLARFFAQSGVDGGRRIQLEWQRPLTSAPPASATLPTPSPLGPPHISPGSKASSRSRAPERSPSSSTTAT